MRYRPEIDGLRTFAIVPVVAFHAGIDLLSGGFTGVDVFFVISGYLISKIIIDEIETSRFSIYEFYKRRILRILPALSVVLLATAITAFAVLLPLEFRRIGYSILSAAFFVSNIYFWRTTDYFGDNPDTKPLLHTWSLSVEEQFYVFFPLLLICVHRFFGRKYALWIGILSALSFVLSALAVQKYASATFYLLPTRVWELGIGALIAAGGAPVVTKQPVRDMLAAAGLGLILFGIFYLSESMTFPAWNALYPCIGTGLIIAYGAQTRIGRLLSLAPVVYVGKISYSLYLWHWPVIVFYAAVNGGMPQSAAGIGFVIALSFALASLSFHFVEAPFRKSHYRMMPAPRILSIGTGALLAFALIGFAIERTGNRWGTYPADVLEIAAYIDYRETPDYKYQFRRGSCFVSGEDDGAGAYDKGKCLVTVPGKKNYLVIGDSHAAHLWRALALEYPDVNLIQATISGCRPLLDAPGQPACRALMNDVLRTFVPASKLDGILFAGRWTPADFDRLHETIAFVKPYVGDIVVFGPIVEYKTDLPTLLAKDRYHKTTEVSAHARKTERKTVSDRLAARLGDTQVRFISLYDAICKPEGCTELTPDGVPLQFDYGHLTLPGARLVVNGLHDQILPAP